LWRQLIVTHSVQGKQVHDARLAALMQAHGITHILTLNGSDFTRYPGITPIDPASLVPPPPPPRGPPTTP
jgi:predicted nucleic acid-binding protein